MIFQSPMTHSAGGSPISPLQVVAKFFKQQQQQAKSPDQVPVYLTAVCRAMLFPGNLVRSVDWSAVVSFDSLAAFANDLNATGVWEEAFELATKQTGWWKSIKSPEILLAGSWSLLFGAVVTIISGRMHFLALMGAGMLGYAMHLNALTPTMQFLRSELVAMKNPERQSFLKFATAVPRLVPDTQLVIACKGKGGSWLPTAQTCTPQLAEVELARAADLDCK